MDVDGALIDAIAEHLEAVLGGTEPRFDAYAWALSMTLAEDEGTFGPLVNEGLRFLSELTLVETRPGRVERVEILGHWQEWSVSDASIRDWYVSWSNAVTADRDSRDPRVEGADDLELWMEIDAIEREVLGDDDAGT